MYATLNGVYSSENVVHVFYDTFPKGGDKFSKKLYKFEILFSIS